MKQYKVEITNEALLDMEKIYNYIAFDLMSPDNALNQYNRIADKIMSLEFLPERIKVIGLEPELMKDMRRISIDNYSIFYVMKGSSVIVTDVLYSASDIGQRLKGI